MPEPKIHDWFIEPREYERQEQRRGKRHAFEAIEASRAALVVIDMVPFFVEESSYCRGVVPNIVRLAATLRGAGGSVAWVVPGSEPPHPKLAVEFFGDRIAELFRTSGGTGDIRNRVWPELAPMAGDLYFEKQSSSAFFPGASDLPAALLARNTDTVFIAGTVTNICCESSARDAAASGFRVIFLADGTAARRDADHNATLHNIYRSFGDVRATSEVVEMLRAGERS